MSDDVLCSMDSANKSAGARGCWWYLTGRADSFSEETRVAYNQKGKDFAVTYYNIYSDERGQ